MHSILKRQNVGLIKKGISLKLFKKKKEKKGLKKINGYNDKNIQKINGLEYSKKTQILAINLTHCFNTYCFLIFS